MKATAKTLRITPKKLNLIADLVRSKDAVEAMEILRYAPKKGAKLLNKVIASAVANATNNFKQDEKSLFIKEVVVTKAPTYKRWLPVSRGRVHPILKRNTHVSVVIGVREGTKPAAKPETKRSTSEKKTAKPAAKKIASPKAATKKPSSVVKKEKASTTSDKA